MKIRLTAAALAIASVIATTGVSGDKTPKGTFKATALLRVALPEPKPAPGDPNTNINLKDRFDIYRNTQAELVMSQTVLEAALRQPGIANLPSLQQPKEKDQTPVQWLQRHVEVKFPGNVELMSVSCFCDDPKEAVALANAIVSAYMSEVVEKEKSKKIARYRDLVRICDTKELEIRGKRRELKQILGGLGAFHEEQLLVQLKLALAELAQYQSESRRIRCEIRTYQRDLAVQNALLKDKDAKDVGRAAILQEIKRLEALIAATTEQEAATNADVAKSCKESKRLARARIDSELLRADIKRAELTLAEFSKERERLSVETRVTPHVTIVHNAEVPARKD